MDTEEWKFQFFMKDIHDVDTKSHKKNLLQGKVEHYTFSAL